MIGDDDDDNNHDYDDTDDDHDGTDDNNDGTDERLTQFCCINPLNDVYSISDNNLMFFNISLLL